jgi:hypothetical protein
MLTWTRWRTGSNDQQENVCEQVRLFSALHNLHAAKSMMKKGEKNDE